MAKFRYLGESPAFVPDLGRDVAPGEVIETDHALNSPMFETVERDRADTAKRKEG